MLRACLGGGGWMIPGPGSLAHLTRLPDGSSEPPRARLVLPEPNPLLFKEGRLGWKEGPRTPCTRVSGPRWGEEGSSPATHPGVRSSCGHVPGPASSTSPPRGAPWRDPHTVAAQAWSHRAGPVTAPAYGWGAPRRSAALVGNPDLRAAQSRLSWKPLPRRSGAGSLRSSPLPCPCL